jgi:hypothetical protein
MFNQARRADMVENIIYYSQTGKAAPLCGYRDPKIA